ncbi:hypothetical protein GEMRC1_009351 [Eukaryota sp. GEM-RC1]
MPQRGTVFRVWAALLCFTYAYCLLSVLDWSESESDLFETNLRLGLCNDNSLTRLFTIDTKEVAHHEQMDVVLSTSSSKSPSYFSHYFRVLISARPRSHTLETATTMQDRKGSNTLRARTFKSIQLWDDSVPITSVPPNTELYHSECAIHEDGVALIAVSSCHLTKPLCGLFFQKIDMNVYGFLNDTLYLHESDVSRSAVKDIVLAITMIVTAGYLYCSFPVLIAYRGSRYNECCYSCAPERYDFLGRVGRTVLLILPLIFMCVIYYSISSVWDQVAFAF